MDKTGKEVYMETKNVFALSKKGNASALTSVGWSLVTFGIVIGLGVVVLDRFGQTTGGTANTTIQYVITQMGSTGLAGWIPVIIVVTIAGLIFAYFGMRGNKY